MQFNDWFETIVSHFAYSSNIKSLLANFIDFSFSISNLINKIVFFMQTKHSEMYILKVIKQSNKIDSVREQFKDLSGIYRLE